MKITRTKSYKLNMGNYESLELSATVSVEDVDLLTEEEIAAMTAEDVRDELTAFATAQVQVMLDPEIEEAAELSQAESSILFDDPKTARPARTRGTTRNRS